MRLWREAPRIPMSDLTIASMPELTIQQRTDLIHFLQRERGVTCGLVGATGIQPLAHTFSVRMKEQRQRTDSKSMGDAALLGMLRSIRAEVDEFQLDGEAPAIEDSPSRAAGLFYSIFTRFNQLISIVLDRSSGYEIYDAFARLKEATGIERAFLCGVLALPRAALAHLPSRAFADLVIGMQQQRYFEQKREKHRGC